jgi:hypothetical protein
MLINDETICAPATSGGGAIAINKDQRSPMPGKLRTDFFSC